MVQRILVIRLCPLGTIIHCWVMSLSTEKEKKYIHDKLLTLLPRDPYKTSLKRRENQNRAISLTMWSLFTIALGLAGLTTTALPIVSTTNYLTIVITFIK